MDIIAAIATGSAPTAIGVVRLSGDHAATLAQSLFHPRGRHHLSDSPRTMLYGTITDQNGDLLDQGMAVFFPGPNSYTGEDSVEFHCHGSIVVLQGLLRALLAMGARQAAPGEFTQRAFLNGKLDLTQAQAVIDLIHAETSAQARHAVAQLDGSLSRDFSTLYQQLLDISAQFYAVVDYPDEDIDDLDVPQILQTLDSAQRLLEGLLSTAQRGRIVKNGVATAIVGRPNVGKSSLLNALLGFERAIVTDLAGTTRDTLEERLLCGDVLLRLIDTAGIRHTHDPIEAMGVQRSRSAVESAQLVLLVLDASAPLTDQDHEAIAMAATADKLVVVRNKADLECLHTPHEEAIPGLRDDVVAVSLSAKTGDGLSQLESAIARLFPQGDVPPGRLLTDPRQEEAARQALEAIVQGRCALAQGLTADAILTDVEQALQAVGTLTGRNAAADVVGRIFERFCVGK